MVKPDGIDNVPVSHIHWAISKQGLGLPDLKAVASPITLPFQEKTSSIFPPFISSCQVGTALKRGPGKQFLEIS